MYTWLRSCLFKLDEEKAHHLALSSLSILPSFVLGDVETKPVKHMGLTFKHPLGLAAGLDKDAQYVNGLAKLGFSFIEVGTVTPKPQAGNPKPRLFRLPEDEALINRMGFNNLGLEACVQHLKRRTYQGVLGVNIGKNKDTPLQDAVNDYLIALEKVYLHADYITINISSPNTPDLRKLQGEGYFDQLLQAILDKREQLTQQHSRRIPILVKVSPDESDESLKRIAHLGLSLGLDGLIATNTTAERPQTLRSQYQKEAGGLSGQPLRIRANACMKLLKQQTGNALTLIGVGGIDSPEAAQERLDAGADLLQIYSGLIYHGPGLVRNIVNHLHIQHKD